MNICIFAGNICDELTDNLKFTRTGKKYLDFSLAVRETKDSTLFLRCRAWEGTADLLLNYCGKGDKITVQGSLKNDAYDSESGKKYYTFINIRELSFGFKPQGR